MLLYLRSGRKIVLVNKQLDHNFDNPILSKKFFLLKLSNITIRKEEREDRQGKRRKGEEHILA